jgi:hypothetical protein
MANTYKLKTKANVGITTVGIYTVPASTTTIIIGIALANISGTGVNVGVGITRVSADGISLMKNVPVPQGSTLEFMAGNKMILEATDTLTIISDTVGSIDASVSIMEMT